MVGGIASIRMLGVVEVERDGVVGVVRAPKERAVLVALGLAAPRLVTVDELHQLLWEADPPSTAVKTVQNYVSRLRRVIGDDVLRHRSMGYQLDVAPEVIDARRFEGQVREGRRLLDVGDASTALQQLEEAEELWAGPVACGSDTTSAVAIGARFQEVRALQRELLAEARLRTGGDVVPVLEAAVAEDPTRERLWELLIRALHRDGRVADGLRAYQRARTALGEVGLSVGDGLREAERALIASTAARDERPDAESVRGLPAAFDRTDLYPLVDREQQLETMTRSWGDALAGRASTVVLVGHAGNGKSRLLAQLAADAHGDGAAVALGAATEIDTIPFALVVDALLAVTDGEVGAELRDQLDSAGTSRSAGQDDERWRRDLIARCEAVLAAVTRDRPLVVALEDLHWADASSIRLLQALITSAYGRVLFACTLRPEGQARPEVESFVAGLRRHPRAVFVEVDALSPAAIQQLLDHVGHSPTSNAARASDLARVTGGNAFLVTEVLREGIEADGPFSPPAAVRDVVAARLSRMDDDAREALVAAAVCGDQVDARLLATMTGIDIRRLAAALDDAVRAGLLEEGRGTTQYRFVHDLTRQAVYGAVSRLDRAALHVAAAAQLRDSHASAAAVAHHLLAAADISDADAAVAWAQRAASEAAARRGFEEAATWLARALEVERDLPPVPDRRARLLYDQGRYMNAAGHTDPGREVFAEAADVVEDPALLAAIAVEYSGSSGAYIDPSDRRVRTLLSRAEAAVPEDAVELRCKLRYAQVGWWVFDADPTPRLAAAEDIATMAADTGEPSLRAIALSAGWVAGLGTRDAHEQRAIAEEVRSILRGPEGGMDALIALMRLWTDRVATGGIDQARETVDDLEAFADATGMGPAQWYAQVLRAFQCYLDGNLSGAVAAADAAERLPTSLGMTTDWNICFLRSRLASMAGDHVAEVQHLARMQDVAPAIASAAGCDVALAGARGDGATTHEALERWARVIGQVPVAIRSLVVGVLAPWAFRYGSAEASSVLHDAIAHERGLWLAPYITLPFGRAEMTLGLLRAGFGDIDQALEDLRTAHEAHVAASAWGAAAESAAFIDEVGERGPRRLADSRSVGDAVR